MDLDQYLEKMNTNTKIIWIQKLCPDFIFWNILGENKGEALVFSLCSPCIPLAFSTKIHFFAQKFHLKIPKNHANMLQNGLKNHFFTQNWCIFA